MFQNRFGVQWMLEEVDKGGGGAPEGGKVRPSELVEKYNGDAMRMAEKLADVLTDNYNYRSNERELKKKLPPEGALILTGDDAAKWNAWNELGSIDDVKKRVADAENAISERDGLKAEKVINHAAQITGYKADVLSDLAKSKGFSVEVEGEGEGAKVVARYKDGEAEAVKPLSEYVEASLAAYLPSLQSMAAAPQGIAPVPFARMAAPGGGQQPNTWDKIRADKQAKAETARAVPAQSWTEKVGIAQ